MTDCSTNRCTEPERVVYLAVPHRGSPLANMTVSMWISRLIRLPKTLTVELLDSTLLAVGDAVQGENPAKRMPTSINSLSPENRATIALNQTSAAGKDRHPLHHRRPRQEATHPKAATAWCPIGRRMSHRSSPKKSSPATTASPTAPKPPKNSNASSSCTCKIDDRGFWIVDNLFQT